MTDSKQHSQLEVAMTVPPLDCTGDCGYGPCNCSGEHRVVAYTKQSVDRLVEQLEAAETRKQELWDRLLDMEGKYLDASNQLEAAQLALREIVAGAKEARDHCDDLEDTGGHVGYTRYESARTDGKGWAALIAQRALDGSSGQWDVKDERHLRAIADAYDPARVEESARVMYDIARSAVAERDERGRILDPEWAERTIERWTPSNPASEPKEDA